MKRGAKPRILIADDQPANILIVTHALKDQYDVSSASTGPEILERIAAGDIDLVLLDVEMPGIDGFEVCRRLKADARTADLPVIFLTARDGSTDEEHGFAVGAVDYITKPIRHPILRARVRTHLELKHVRDQLQQLASVDALTGIANRRRFDELYDTEWRRASRGGRWLSFAMADVDDFKAFNDAYGHLAGDQCLRAIASNLDRITRRPGELAARYGGEEFALVFPEIDPIVMRRIMAALLDGVAALGIEHSASRAGPIVTVSVGAVSVRPSRDLTSLEVIEAADRLLYQAKNAGRDRCVHGDLMEQTKTLIVRDMVESRPRGV